MSKKWNIASFRAAKGVRKLGCTTAYDAAFARLADEAGVPCLLVGDSMGMTMLGYATTLPVKMEETLSATAAVARAAKDALVIADMPFGSYQCGDDLAMKNAVDCLKAGADGVKLEGGARVCGLIKRMTEAGIPVLAHVGMTPQSVNEYGGFKVQGKTREAADAIFADALAVEQAESLCRSGRAEDLVRCLRACRCDALEEIHIKQKQLDRLDMLIRAAKNM